MMAKVLRYPMSSLEKVYHVSSEAANCSLEAVVIGAEQNRSVKSVRAKCLLVVD